MCRLEEYDYDAESGTVGFQVDRVKNGGNGEGKLRLTAYHKRSGKVQLNVQLRAQRVFMRRIFAVRVTGIGIIYLIDRFNHQRHFLD